MFGEVIWKMLLPLNLMIEFYIESIFDLELKIYIISQW